MSGILFMSDGVHALVHMHVAYVLRVTSWRIFFAADDP